jgi:hypothetical protein
LAAKALAPGTYSLVANYTAGADFATSASAKQALTVTT